jgi:DNA-binding NarL/FixJ family response regulator
MRSDFERFILNPAIKAAGSNGGDAVARGGWNDRYTEGGSPAPHGVSETLTPRERDILTMISQGLSNKHIARTLKISPETVKSHVKNVFLKLSVGTRAAAVSRAGALGLL